ncbi:MAG: hypothetical protein EBS91_00020 [Betaproteobacteria bacterium]|nr:hypothetical protein [Betaproteobacteria bacterium]NCA23022.1 hypothetical protein [Betaproteobacteria bacterium]
MMHAEYVTSLVKTLRAMSECGISYTLLNKYSSFVPTARELTLSDTWQHNYSSSAPVGGNIEYKKIFWIDSDIEWEPADFLALYDSDLDIVSGLYVLDTAGTVAANFPNDRGVPTRINKVEFMLHDKPVEVGGVGFGFLCVKHGVFESIPRPWFLIGRVQWSPESEMRVNAGEDYSWCARAQAAGYKIWVDPAVKVKHHKETVYEV